MEYTFARLPKSEVKISVSLPFSEFEPHVKKAAVLISESIEIEGFRKGKAPYGIVKQRVGEAAIYEQAAELAVRASYPEALTRLRETGELSPARPAIGKPEITVTKLAPGNPLEYKVRVAVLPGVTLPDYRSIARRVRPGRKEQTVSEEETEAAMRWLRESRATLVTVSRAAATGDRVEVDFAIRSEGALIAGGDSRNHPFILGNGRFIPGFEEAIEGMKQDEEKTFSLMAPVDWRDPQFAGKTLDITATMRLVQERRMPELTDEFAKGMGNFASLDAMQESIRAGILAEKTEKETQRVRAAMIAEIAKEARMEVPDVLIAGETEKMLVELKSGVEQMGMRWPDYLTHIKKTEESLKAEWRTEGEHRVRTALALREIGMRERIEPSEEEVALQVQQMLSAFRTAAQAQRSLDPAELHEYAQGILRNEKVFAFLENRE